MVVTQIFFIFTRKLGEDFQFDEHIFQMGWFNHQLVSDTTLDIQNPPVIPGEDRCERNPQKNFTSGDVNGGSNTSSVLVFGCLGQ